MVTGSPELSIIVVLYNSAIELPECLESVQGDLESGWAELIFVNNASPDASVEVARQQLPGATVIDLPENRGFAGGVNAALGEASGRYLLLLNPDVTMPEGGLRELTKWMDRHARVAAASPAIVSEGGRVHGPSRFPSVWGSLLEITRVHKLLPPHLRSRLLLGAYWDGLETLQAGWVPGTAMIVRAEVVRAVGPLAATLFMYGEDIEWCWRMRRAGFLVGVHPGVRIQHLEGTSATRSWGDVEAQRRLTAGIYAAVRLMYGPRHARAVAVAIAVALGAEGLAPGRAREARFGSWQAARRWLALAFSS